MPIDSNLLNKIRAVIALRDKGATEGERDAAQQRLTVLLAKHGLTEQDIPSDSFSTRGRSYRPPHHTRRNPSSAEFNAAFEETLRRFREAAFASSFTDPHTGQPQRERERTGAGNPPKRGRSPARMRFEQAFGGRVSEEAWKYVKTAHARYAETCKPSNPNAFSRAFYEKAGLTIKDRVDHKERTHRLKSNNTHGVISGRQFGEKASLEMFLFRA